MTEGFWIIYAIFWWVLAAIGAVSLITYAFVCFEYYRWDKEEREREKIHKIIVDIDNSSE